MLCFFVLIDFVVCLVYPMLPVSLDCPFLNSPSVFSNVYLTQFLLKCLYQTKKVNGHVFVYKGYRFDLFLRFDFWFWNCFDSVVFFVFHFIISKSFCNRRSLITPEQTYNCILPSTTLHKYHQVTEDGRNKYVQLNINVHRYVSVITHVFSFYIWS